MSSNIPESSIKAAAFSGVLSVVPAVVLGGTALAVPAFITGVATSVIDTVVSGLSNAFFNVGDGARGHFTYNVARHAMVLAITAATVVPLVGLLGTAYKVSLLGSFLVALFGNATVRGVSMKDDKDQSMNLLASGYCLLPAPFLSLCAARILQGLTLLKG